MKYSRIIPAAGFLLLAGCMNANAGRDGEGVEAPEKDVTVEFRVENAQGDAVRSFAPNATVRFVFSVKNSSTRAQQLAYTFPPHRVQVLSKGNKAPIWQAWQGKMFPQVMRNTTLPANGSESFSIEWQIDAALTPGSYRVQPAFHGFVDGEKLSAQIAPVDITIE